MFERLRSFVATLDTLEEQLAAMLAVTTPIAAILVVIRVLRSGTAGEGDIGARGV